MEDKKVTRKELRASFSESITATIAKLGLSGSSKKLEKVVAKSMKKLAAEFYDGLKKERKKEKKSKKELKSVEKLLNGKKSLEPKDTKAKKAKKVFIAD